MLIIMVYVSGIIDFSTIDYPKKSSSVIFLSGCNMKCKYCHNLHFISNNRYNLSVDEVINKIDFFFTDAVVISGGEPTLQSEVIDLAKKIKSLGFPIKIDTNGTNPEIIEKLIKDNLVDYVALDVKCKFDKYPELTNYKGDIKNKILKIINMCKDNNIFIECRTTFIPKFMDETDIIEICKTIKDCDLYAIQQFNPKDAYDDNFKKLPQPKMEELIKLGKLAKKYVKNVVIRGDWIVEL